MNSSLIENQQWILSMTLVVLIKYAVIANDDGQKSYIIYIVFR